ncbi:hypothetical protein [Streptomyces niger]|uniref:hypothetical protein n=1 Tax=Streptomyces niger TaxID=66373 RepID=UPI000B0D9629|nr:hypothetical protein [Streptomyces niger]
MQLAGADGGGWSTASEGAGGGLKSKKSAWTKAGRDVLALSGDIKKALARMEREQKGLGAGSDTGGSGVECGAAQRELYHSWKRYLEDVSGRCRTLQDRLENAGDHLDKNDDSVKSSFDALSHRYDDTDAVGGGRYRGK